MELLISKMNLYNTIIRTTSFIFLITSTASAFQGNSIVRPDRIGSRSGSSRCFNNITPRHLIPLSKFEESISFFSEPDKYRCCINEKGFLASRGNNSDTDLSSFELGLIEEEDLQDVCRFVITAFGAEAIRLSSNINEFEKMLLNPAVGLVNDYSFLVTFAEVFSGTKQRIGNRLNDRAIISAPDLEKLSYEERVRKAEHESLILILARPATTTSGNSRTVEVIASIELRLQPCDAKIPFSIPWLDRVERKLVKLFNLVSFNTSNNNIQPYLSNLCVDEKFRGQKIGRGLVRCVENIAKTSWGYDKMYLHVDEENPAALNLYKSEGYCRCNRRWNPFWSGPASDIGYYVKLL